MNLKRKDLIDLPVFTQSGQPLGRVVDFEFDPDSQSVVKYYVKSRDIIKELWEKELLIDREQVVSITVKKMIVEDAVVYETEKKKEMLNKAVPAN